MLARRSFNEGGLDVQCSTFIFFLPCVALWRSRVIPTQAEIQFFLLFTFFNVLKQSAIPDYLNR